jgi:anti-sigma B factor antagonist
MLCRYPGISRGNRNFRSLEGPDLVEWGEPILSSEQREIADGTLVVRSARNGDTHVIALCGELDLANAGTAERELEASFGNGGASVVVDMRELEFIDSTGIALLVAALGRNEPEARVRFIPSASPAVARVLAVTGLTERLPLAEA